MPIQYPPTLDCPAGAGSLNNAEGAPPVDSVAGTPAPAPYVVPTISVGTWQITGTDPDICATNEQLIEATYVAESLNISGAPLNIYPLLGVHQQGNGSVLSQGTIVGSTASPGYPLSGINVTGQSWRSLQTGTSVGPGVFVGVDFGIKLLTEDNQQSEYDPQAPKFTPVGAIYLTQSNNPGYFASQIKVEITDGSTYPLPATFLGTGNGTFTPNNMGINATAGSLSIIAISSTTFNVYFTFPNSTMINLGVATVGEEFFSVIIDFTITAGSTPFVSGDMFSVTISYNWKRVGLFNVVQSPSPQLLNLKTVYSCKAVMITPTLFNGQNNWEVDAIDVVDAPPVDINNIQDLFFNENRDRDYGTTPLLIKAQYNPADSLTDLSKFGLSIMDQYTFTVAFTTMIALLGRPIVVGDIIEVIPDLQWDQNLLPVRKFLEVSDAGWSAAGYGPQYNPTVYRFSAQQALPSQETRDIFGTMDTQKYLVADSILGDNVAPQIDTTPLTNTEQIIINASDAVPQIGSDDERSIESVLYQAALPPVNAKGQPAAAPNPPLNPKANIYIEAGLPPNGLLYGEGYSLPAIPGPSDGAYFRLLYPSEMNIPARLYRFSLIKNAWIYIETDRRGRYSSFKPSTQKVFNSTTSVPLSKKLT